MAWTIEWSRAADRDLEGLGTVEKRRIIEFMELRVAPQDNPRLLGQQLRGGRLGHLFRYRVGDYRVIASIQDVIVTILVVAVGHRREVYR
jgi:mRNA interferase RelE/StbE